MPPMKIQPIDIDPQRLKETVVRNETAKPVLKSRLRRLFVFDRQLPSVLRTSSSEKPIATKAPPSNKDAGVEFEPSSVCLAKMVQNFMEESYEKQPPPPKCGRNRCNCFNANNESSDEEEFDIFNGSFAESITDSTDSLMSLIPCTSVAEKNLLADTAKIVEKNKVYKRKDDLTNIVADGLSSLGYDSSICKSKWEKTSSRPAGEYEFIEIVEGERERIIVDIDFRSEFDIARSTGTYKAILQSLPFIFVGKSERLGKIVSIVSEAAKQSLRKKGMHVPPWRKVDYMLAKWLSPSCARAKQPSSYPSVQVAVAAVPKTLSSEGHDREVTKTESDCGELELIFGEMKLASEQVEEIPAWTPPAVKPKRVEKGMKVVTGFASLLKDKP